LLPENVGAISDKHGKRFQQDISQIEMWYSGKWSPKLADYCWSLVWETPTGNKEEAKDDEWVFNKFFFLVRIPYIETVFII